MREKDNIINFGCQIDTDDPPLDEVTQRKISESKTNANKPF